MTTVSVFVDHNAVIETQRVGQVAAGLTAGHKKDVVISTRLSGLAARVAIYGWHQTNGRPIQPLYVGHHDSWVDYSHGVRLVSRDVVLDGISNTLARVLSDPLTAPLLSDEGVVTNLAYGMRLKASVGRAEAEGELPSTAPHEIFKWVQLGANVRAMVSEPDEIRTNVPVHVICYALPNGNTIEQTVGRRPAAATTTTTNDDWHFHIQQIGAQTRWLRATVTNEEWVVVYLEAEGLAWPNWRRRFSDSSGRIVEMVERVLRRYGDQNARARLTLCGHSGGGSWIFGYLDGVASVPSSIERIAFLDANYGYDPAKGHLGKLADWLKEPSANCLTVLAYDDASALLDGKSFVSAAGGTWGRSHLMLTNFAQTVRFTHEVADGLHAFRGLGGRIEFLLKENPERKILHTVQVERNGFIEAMLSGTAYSNRDYRYFGDPVYAEWMLP